MANKSGIYGIQGPEGKLYIGSAVDIVRRWRKHKYALNDGTHRNQYLQRAWDKYGSDNFSFIVLEYVQDQNKLLEAEQAYLDKYDKSLLYNIMHTAGSAYGYKHSAEARQAIKVKNTGKYVTDITKERISQSRVGNDWPAKTYKMIDPDGNSVFIHNLSKFCRENRLSQGHMSAVLAGTEKQYKGWRKDGEQA